jgi:hypothetical protein
MQHLSYQNRYPSAWKKLFVSSDSSMFFSFFLNVSKRNVDPIPPNPTKPRHADAQLAAGVAVDSPAYQALENTAEPGCKYT